MEPGKAADRLVEALKESALAMAIGVGLLAAVGTALAFELDVDAIWLIVFGGLGVAGVLIGPFRWMHAWVPSWQFRREKLRYLRELATVDERTALYVLIKKFHGEGQIPVEFVDDIRGLLRERIVVQGYQSTRDGLVEVRVPDWIWRHFRHRPRAILNDNLKPSGSPVVASAEDDETEEPSDR